MHTFKSIVETVGLTIDALGVAAIVAGLILAAARFFRSPPHTPDPYKRFRQDLGRGILLGLEFLVAADIIRTVAVSPTLQSVLVLGLVVLIRTFLSMSLQIELEGRLPWQQSPTAAPAPTPPPKHTP